MKMWRTIILHVLKECRIVVLLVLTYKMFSSESRLVCVYKYYVFSDFFFYFSAFYYVFTTIKLYQLYECESYICFYLIRYVFYVYVEVTIVYFIG